jgi:hypothetical protein
VRLRIDCDDDFDEDEVESMEPGHETTVYLQRAGGYQVVDQVEISMDSEGNLAIRIRRN